MVNSSGSLSRYIVAGALFMTGLLPGGTAAAQTRQQIDWCVNDGNLFSRDLQISGCTAVIQSGQREERDLSWAFHNRAYAYYKKDNYQDAIVDFNEAIRLNPIDATALNNRCWVRTIVGRDLSQALEDCNESLRLRAKDAHSLDSRGFTCLKLGQFNHAISDYNAALELDPSQAESYFGRGVAKFKTGDKQGGNADIATATVIQTDIVETFAKYGVRLDEGGVSIAPVTAARGEDCARAVSHRKGADGLKTLANYDDHLSRYANLNRKWTFASVHSPLEGD